MPDLNKTYLYRMFHIDNINHMWEYGITKIDSPNANKDYKSIGDGSLINTRNSFVIPNGNTLGQYIPFYFFYRMPMLYVIQKGYNQVNTVQAKEIVYCVLPISQIIDNEIDYLFTDGHGANYLSNFYEPKDILKLEELLDFKAIKDPYWKDDVDLDKKRRKEAEFLAASDIPKSAIIAFVVYNQTANDKLINVGIPQEMIHIKPNFYF